MTAESPNYYAIIPANVRYDKRLCANAKLLYGEITALCNAKGFCWAGNAYFSELYDVSKVSISKWVKQLVDAGYLKTQLFYKDGTKEILRRSLTIVYDPPQEKLAPPPRKVYDPTQEKFKDNTTLNITNNNTLNNTDINITPAKAVVKNKLNWLSILVNDYQISEDIAQQFIDHRKNKKAPMSKIVLDNLIAQSKIIGITLEAAIKEMIINNWVGFKAEWIKNQTSKNNFNKIEKNNSDLKSQNYPNDVCKF